MLKILLPTITLIPMSMIIKKNLLFISFSTFSMILGVMSLQWLKIPMTNKYQNLYTTIDQISAPLLVLSYWLLPIMVLASQNHLKYSTSMQKRVFLMCLAMLQSFLVMALSSTNLLLFFLMFEATLIPTMIIITRWGNQKERLTAGMYFMLYTLVTSMPLLIALLINNYKMLHSNILFSSMLNPELNMTMWLACTMAFMVKMPLYGLHLWLPKAHVEAPIAGSMVLAAILLKLGGYGMMRISPMLYQLEKLHLPFIVLSLWGMIMASLICLRQPDLKSLIAYSSVSHMGLIVMATMIQTPSSLTGAMMLMVAHGITSSMLFCLANIMYERTNTRTLIMMQGMQIAMPLMTAFWFLANLTNMAIPPTINLFGEIMIIMTTFNWSAPTLIITSLTAAITAIYSMHMFLTSQQGKLPKDMMIYPPHTREYLIITLHLIPTMLLIINPQIIMLTQ
uniref:NADH-ubiquinone oxidoreductase chain 4 n=1 Tax=Brookesia decaryi TaxID=587619 RepID=D6RRX8_BRODE|nr:NADH dehydrogenase subunit 4 [Brookesia decaryi]BAJ08069.1 NADH dehydrogenase subunit 4 [Brookesia decaryi]